ncbi:MAG: SDR family oxidoreductase [Pirellulales bacterium]
MSQRSQGHVVYENRGRVALVTGGCNGIGRAIVDAFCQSGASVVCVDVDGKGARDLPPGVHFHHGSVADASFCKMVLDWTKANLGGLDILVNNAAIQPPTSYVPLHEVALEDFERMVKINLAGYHLMAQHAVPIMMDQRSGVIINIASGQGHRTARQVSVYGPIKAANILQAMQWGIEYARHGIRVVSVSPGAIMTPLVEASLAAQGGADKLANRHPLGRIGAPHEIANAVLWLCSPHASFITATDVSVDGGLAAFGAFAEPYDPASMPSSQM